MCAHTWRVMHALYTYANRNSCLSTNKHAYRHI